MIWINLNLHHMYIRKLSCKSGLFWFSGCWKDFSMTHPIFVIIAPLKELALYLNILKSHCPTMFCTKFDWNCPSFVGEDFRNISVYFYSFAIISLGEWGCPSFEQFWVPLTKGWFVPTLVRIDPADLEKLKMWKSHGQTDNQKSSLEFSAHVS
jgi:hypothetical protein